MSEFKLEDDFETEAELSPMEMQGLSSFDASIRLYEEQIEKITALLEKERSKFAEAFVALASKHGLDPSISSEHYRLKDSTLSLIKN